MTAEVMGATVEIMGKVYQIKCQEQEAASLKQAAKFLEGEIREIRKVSNVMSIDRIAVMAALNIAHQFLALEQEKQGYSQNIAEGLRDLQAKIDDALARHAQLELSSAE